MPRRSRAGSPPSAIIAKSGRARTGRARPSSVRRRHHREHQGRRHRARRREGHGEQAPRRAAPPRGPHRVEPERQRQEQRVEQRRRRSRQRRQRHRRAEGHAPRRRGPPRQRPRAQQHERRPGEPRGEVELPVVPEEGAQGEERRPHQRRRPPEALAAEERGHEEARQVEVEDHARVRPVRRRRGPGQRADRPVERVVGARLRVGGEGRAAVLPRVPAGDVAVRQAAAEHDEVGPVLLGYVAFEPGRGPSADEVRHQRVEEEHRVQRQRDGDDRPRGQGAAALATPAISHEARRSRAELVRRSSARDPRP